MYVGHRLEMSAIWCHSDMMQAFIVVLINGTSGDCFICCDDRKSAVSRASFICVHSNKFIADLPGNLLQTCNINDIYLAF